MGRHQWQLQEELEDRMNGLELQVDDVEEVTQIVSMMWDTYQKHFEAIRDDFFNLDSKMDMTIDAVNEAKRDISMMQ